MLGAVGKFGALGLGMGAVATVCAYQPKTKNGEKTKNGLTTLADLGVLGGGYVLAKNTAKANPEFLKEASQKTGKYIEYTVKKAKSLKSKKVGEIASKLFNKVKSSTIGGKIIDFVSNTAEKVTSNSTVQKALTKAAEYLEKFSKASTSQKGKYAIIGAAASLLALGLYKVVTNYYKKSGAIDQKYADLYAKYEQMLAAKPIMDGRTGEPITFEQYCKYAQTLLK